MDIDLEAIASEFKKSKNPPHPFAPHDFRDPAKTQKDFETRKHILFVDNRDRPGAPGSSPFSFTMPLTETYENVVSVELRSLVFPKVADEMYVVVDIHELDGVMDSTDNANHRKFAVAFFDGIDATDPSKRMRPGDRKAIKGVDFYQKVKLFNPPMAKLARLTVDFRTYGGRSVTAADTGDVVDASFILEITTANKNVGRIQ